MGENFIRLSCYSAVLASVSPLITIIYHKTKMYSRTLIAIVLVLDMTICGAETTTKPEADNTGTSNPVLFTLMGRTAMKTAYGHMVVPLGIKNLKKAFDILADMLSAVNSALSWSLENYKHKQKSLELLRKKVDILHHLSIKTGQRTHFEKWDDANEFNITLFEEFEDNHSAWRPSTSAPRTISTTTEPILRRKRDMADDKIETLPGFGLNLFPKSQLEEIWKEANKEDDEPSIHVTTKVDASTLRIHNIAEHITKVNKVLKTLINTARDVQDKKPKNIILNEVDTLTHQIQGEIDLFLGGVSRLLDRQFGVTLADPDKLQKWYDTLSGKARTRGLQTVSEDAGIIFRSETSVIRTADGDLTCIIHIPMYSGQLMHLYRYIDAPFLLAQDVVATIKSEKEFLAIDSTGTLGKEMSLADLANCKVVNRIYHCGSENVLQKNLKQLCLYNLYHQRVEGIEENCRVEISKTRSHAVQLSGSQFRILVTSPTRLTRACKSGDTKVETLNGVNTVTLDEECPKASTPDHLFVRNPDLLSSQQLIALPLIEKATEWIESIEEKFKQVDLEEIFENINEDFDRTVTIQTFRDRINNASYRSFRKMLEWASFGTSGFIIFTLVTWVFRKLFLLAFWSMPFLRKGGDVDNLERVRDNQPYRKVYKSPRNERNVKLLTYKRKPRPSAPVPEFTNYELELIN